MELLTKLRINTTELLYLINAPKDVLHLFDSAELKTVLPGKVPATQLILFAENSKILDNYILKLEGKLSDKAVFWIVYPKKSGRIQSDLTRNDGWKLVFSLYDGASSASINEDWSGVRFKLRGVSKSTWIPMEERKTEGIDYVARTVSLPADALKAMKSYKGLDDFFYAMSFTHKKEYVASIVDAKKPETRQRRIEKMIEMLLKMRTEKELKKRKAKP
ncbi:MAG: YdeI/OmpD-associated family protein [Bacteroidetes bacterium]|nr:YdeI/OmpD-associated family protein [Bacteroidota bacterium]